MKPRHAAALGAVLGLLMPLVCELVLYIHPYVAGAWLLWIWPSSLQLMVLEGNGISWVSVIIVFTISIAINVVLYAGVGWLAGFVYSKLHPPKIRTSSA
jgi:hypothetical protein